MAQWGSIKERETNRRIQLTMWAYAYEFDNSPLVEDYIFDVESYQVNLSVTTNRPDLDFWFNCNFQACTGMWIRSHPELDKVKKHYEKWFKK